MERGTPMENAVGAWNVENGVRARNANEKCGWSAERRKWGQSAKYGEIMLSALNFDTSFERGALEK